MPNALIKGRVGPLAERPGAGEYVGQRYNATDSNDEFEWNGAAWLPVGFREMRWQGATDLLTLAGTPTLVTTNDSPAWEVDAAEGICGIYTLPHGWGRAEPHLVVYVPVATAGDLTFRLRIRSRGFLEGANSAYDYDQNVVMSTHPQNIPLPLVFPQIDVAGNIFTWRVDRSDAQAFTARVEGMNWERIY